MSEHKHSTESLAPHRQWLEVGNQPAYLHPPSGSTVKRPSQKPLIPLAHALSELTGPVYGHDDIGPLDNDLTNNAVNNGEPLGERIIVVGRVTDEVGRPIRNALLEVWQANAAGRYMHKGDQNQAPLDPNFHGAGRVLTDANGNYRFTTIKPGAYPMGTNVWRPPHIHFSIFGLDFLSRLVTQMYFPGDPLLAQDPVYNSVPDEAARRRLISTDVSDITIPEWARGYRFDIVLCGSSETPFETKEV